MASPNHNQVYLRHISIRTVSWQDWQTGKHVQHSAVMGLGFPRAVMLRWLDQAGFGAVDPLRSSRFLLMQVHVGYRLA